ncbi:MAG TPA: hypothetical protein VIF37_03855 [Methylobacter sp.]|jgi:hypothetical protein
MIYGIPKPGDCATAIARWSVREVVYGDNAFPTRHLVGYVLKDIAGRTTSAIESFDRDNGLIRTSSGRLYQLMGGPGCHDDAKYVWEQWSMFNRCRDEKVVTSDYF